MSPFDLIPRHSSITNQVDQLSQWTPMALRMYVYTLLGT